LTAEGGVLDFCELPVHIKDKNEIYYSNVYPDNVENPWGVKIIDIKVSHMLNKFKNRANQSPKSNSKRYNENLKTQNKRIKKSKGTYCDLSTKRGCELLVDTGTYLTYIPRPMFNKIFNGYKFDYFENCDNYLKGKLPTISFELESEKGNFHINLEPEDYLIKYIDNNI